MVDDTRSDSQKVSDILRIWSQIRTPDETLIWNEIAERDLEQTISLNSGIRTPKTFIEKDIKAFRDLKETEKSELLKKLINSPKNPNPCESTFPDESVPSDKNLSHYVCLDDCPTPNVGLKEEKMQSILLDDCPIIN